MRQQRAILNSPKPGARLQRLLMAVVVTALSVASSGCRSSPEQDAPASERSFDPQEWDAKYYVQYCERTGGVREALRSKKGKAPKWHYLRAGEPNDGRGPWRTVTPEELKAVGIDLHELRRSLALPDTLYRSTTAPTREEVQ